MLIIVILICTKLHLISDFWLENDDNHYHLSDEMKILHRLTMVKNLWYQWFEAIFGGECNFEHCTA